VLSAVSTGIVRRYALRSGMVDVPNQRSSHRVPTARGGGIAIALIFLIATILLAGAGLLAANTAWALAGGGLVVAWTGWRDDRKHVSVKWRLTAHFVAALWALFCLDGMFSLQWGGGSIAWGYAGAALTLAGMVWLTNLYNFMDGIDGLAAAQAVSTAGVGGVILWVSGAYGLSLTSFALAAASAGFLMWNWPPARIFMGDVGSGLLGFSFAVLAIASEKSNAFPALGWLLLLAIFATDATFTLIRRIIHKQPWSQAHRTHAYQCAVQLGASHRQVTLSVVFLNIFVLSPLAWLVWWRPAWLLWVCLAVGALALLIWSAIQYRYNRTAKD